MPPYFVFIANSAAPETASECRFLANYCARAFGVKVLLTTGETCLGDLAGVKGEELLIYCPLVSTEMLSAMEVVNPQFLIGGLLTNQSIALLPNFNHLILEFPSFNLWEESSRPKVSMVGALLFQAFSGEQTALLDGSLSLASLQLFFERNLPPEVFIHGGNNNKAIISDFSAAPLARLNLESLTLTMYEPLRVKEVLTQIKHWGNYTKEQISFAVNRDLASYYLPSLEKLAAGLVNGHTFAAFEVEVQAQETEIFFPNGFFTASYEPVDKKLGRLVLTLELEKIWLQDAYAMIKLLETLHFTPLSLLLLPEETISLDGVVERGKARGFTLVALGEEKVTLVKNDLEVTFENNCLLLESPKLHLLLTTEQKLLPILADLLPWD